jgi:hypothetical protein
MSGRNYFTFLTAIIDAYIFHCQESKQKLKLEPVLKKAGIGPLTRILKLQNNREADQWA